MNILKIAFIVLVSLISLPCLGQQSTHLLYVNKGGFQSVLQAEVFQNYLESKEVDPLMSFLSLDPTLSNEKFRRMSLSFEKFCEKLKDKKSWKSDEKFLEYVFLKTRKKFLKQYQINSPLYKTFQHKQYDCVSGTALYALILQKLLIPYTIKETKFHVYLLVNFNQHQFLIESTDPYHGVISDSVKIRESEQKYLKQDLASKNYYVYKGEINEKIGLKELSALEYYNHGIDSYNNKDILSSLSYFEKALRLYNSPRIQEIFKKALSVLEKQAYYSKSVGLAQSYQYYSKIIKK